MRRHGSRGPVRLDVRGPTRPRRALIRVSRLLVDMGYKPEVVGAVKPVRQRKRYTQEDLRRR